MRSLNRTETPSDYTSDFKNSYQYDTLNRLTDIVQQGQSGGNGVTSKHFTLSYNALGQKTNIARYQSTGATSAVSTTDFTYDTANRLSGIAHKQGATNLNTYGYAYDGLSRFTTITSTAEGTDTFAYDATSQVTGATHTSQSNETYGFDLNGNRNTSGYSVSTNNQTTAGQGFTYTYDNEGNRTLRTETSTGKLQTYEWDHRNRLIRVTEKPSSMASITKEVLYSYDAFNRLVKRTLDADGAGSAAATSQYWSYDDGINALVQFEGSAASTLSHRYLWANEVDQLLSDEQVTSLSTGGNTLYALSDHLGTIRDIADFNESTGITTIANHRTYNAYGKLISETNAAVDLLFGFTGKQLDEATGLQHNLNRWYDSGLGQWLSEDPIGFRAGDENIRRYIRNKSTLSIDPTGLHDDAQQAEAYSQAQKQAQDLKNLNDMLVAAKIGAISDAAIAVNTASQEQFKFDCDHVSTMFVNYANNMKSSYIWSSQPNFQLYMFSQPASPVNALYENAYPAYTGVKHAYVVASVSDAYYVINVTKENISPIPDVSGIIAAMDADAKKNYESTYAKNIAAEALKVHPIQLINTIWEKKYKAAWDVLQNALKKVNGNMQNYKPTSP